MLTFHRTSTICMLALSAALVVPQRAQAQPIDYGSLQSLFGEPVTTSATGTPQRAKDAPVNMTILTADDIRHSGSRNIPEILRQVPGIDVMQTGLETYDVGVRGYNQPFQPRLLVLVNGRQVFLDDYSRTDWNAIPVNIDEIRQIEVVKGPNAALFGNNAVGGVVNIVTYNPIYDKVNVANVTGGTQNLKQADATVSDKLGNWGGVKLSAGGLNADEFDTSRPAEYQAITISPQRRYASAEGVFQLSPTIQGELETSYVKSQAGGGSIAGLYGNSLNEVSSVKASLAAQTDYGLVQATTYMNHGNINLQISSPLIGRSQVINDLYVGRLEDQFKIGTNNTFRIAGEYRNSYFESDAAQFQPAAKSEMDVVTASASGMWNWQILTNLSLTNAVRIDQRQQSFVGTLFNGAFFNYGDYKQNITGVNVNSGLVWQATDLDTFRLTYGRGLQYPSYYESGSLITIAGGGGTTEAIQGDPRLNPTIVTNYEADYDRDIKPLFSTLRTGVFYTENRDIKAISGSTFVNPPIITIASSNVGDSHAFGLELGLNGSKDGFHWGASYSLADVTDDPQVLTNVHYERSAPQNAVKVNLGYTWKQWEFDGFGNYVSERQSLLTIGAATSPSPVNVDGYASLSGRIGYNINDNFTLALSGTGLNRQNLDNSAFPNSERQVFFGLTGKF